MNKISDRYIFEIGVYPSEPESFFAERSKRLQARLKWLANAGGVEPDQAPDVFENTKEYFLKKYGGWRYTQAIGWIRLFVFGRQMRGEYCFVNAKRIDREMNKRKFEYCGKAFELSFFPGEDTSIEIFHQTLNAIDRLRAEKPFRGRFIDLESFKNIGKHVNWRNILGLD